MTMPPRVSAPNSSARDSGAPPEPPAEARLFCRYLIGTEASADLLERYAAGCRRLFGGTPEPGEAAVIAFALRRPWSLPFLDAASGLAAPQSELRRRLLLMLALLEACPDHADFFLPEPPGRMRAVARIGRAGLSAAAKAALGLLLLPLARRAS